MPRAIVIAALLLLAFPARARLITITVEGVLDQVRDDFGLLPGVEPGDPFTASYTYESETPASGCLFAPAINCETYVFPASMEIALEAETGGLAFALDNARAPETPLQATFADTPAGDEARIEIWETRLPERRRFVGIFDFSGDTSFLSSTELQIPDIARADTAGFRLILRLDEAGPTFAESAIRGSIARLYAVPEPAPVAVLGLALAAGLALRRGSWAVGAAGARWSMLLFFGVLAPAAEARPITVEFEAVVTWAMDWFFVLPETPIGSAVAGSYWYQEEDAEIDHGAATGGVEFALKSKHAGFEFTVADSTYRFSNASDPDGPLALTVADGEYRVSWTGSARSPFGTPPLVEERITDEIRLSILGEGIESSSFETVPLPPALAGRRAEFHFAARRNERPFSARPISVQSGFRATITTLRVVPEPTALALLGLALAALLAARGVRTRAGR